MDVARGKGRHSLSLGFVGQRRRGVWAPAGLWPAWAQVGMFRTEITDDKVFCKQIVAYGKAGSGTK